MKNVIVNSVLFLHIMYRIMMASGGKEN